MVLESHLCLKLLSLLLLSDLYKAVRKGIIVYFSKLTIACINCKWRSCA